MNLQAYSVFHHVPKAKYATTNGVLSIQEVTSRMKVKACDFTHESKGFIITTLRAAREILAGEFSDPHGISKRLVEVGNVVNEVLILSTVPVESHGINLVR